MKAARAFARNSRLSSFSTAASADGDGDGGGGGGDDDDDDDDAGALSVLVSSSTLCAMSECAVEGDTLGSCAAALPTEVATSEVVNASCARSASACDLMFSRLGLS
eukprot:4583836-Pleurochrysis_carterae.AAC.1